MLKAKCTGANKIPLHYNNAFSTAIYKLMKLDSPEFAVFLKSKEYVNGDDQYDLFSFAIKLENYFVDDHNLYLISPNIILYISLPFIDPFIRNSVLRTLRQQSLVIEDDLNSTNFSITQVSIFAEPQFNEEMKFILLSPLILSIKTVLLSRTKRYYLKPVDAEKINKVLSDDLVNKYKRRYNKEIQFKELKLSFEEDYLNTHEGVIKKLKLKKEGNHFKDVFGMIAPFTLKGNPELIKIGYECGFGEMNYLGFGLAVVKHAI